MPQALSLSSFKKQLRAVITDGVQDELLTFEGVDRDLALKCYDSLSTPQLRDHKLRFSYDSSSQTLTVFAMPSNEHECVADWLVKCWGTWLLEGLLPRSSMLDLSMMGSPKQDKFAGRFEGSIKLPDYCFKMRGLPFPTVVLETGMSESYAKLLRDKDIWITGSAGFTKVVLLVKITRGSGGVTAFLELWRTNSCPHRITVLPEPDQSREPQQDPVLTLQDLYGDCEVPAGTNADQELPLYLGWLRTCIYQALDLTNAHNQYSP
ncbi:hypothetical protein Dda_0661 [Drechslerella dactyloides]|uniref:Uncharacterized protein n=1 Tax=Drechslerella dactyloides TaxID=74499 RepID=A0AAD6J6P1_DREDA|nr:hypothetical protein Dda_0661 [Drechslerella dactyloides]